jgi:predicted alpha/beta hydrolase family esterase
VPSPILILPGYLNSDSDHWQSHWERDHPEYRRVQQRDWDAPVRAEWVAALDAAIAAAEAPPVLVAHSLGCVTIAHWAAAHARPIRGALLVAPADIEQPEFAALFATFAPVPLAPLPFPSILVASANDTYCSFARSEQFATAWGSRFVTLGLAGHINADAGYGPWPQGQRLLAELQR